MSESIDGMKRTHMCTEVNESHLGTTVTLMGWVNRRRDLGKLIFITLRDRTGLIQIFVDGNTSTDEIFKKAETVRPEFVLAVKGEVCNRTDGNINPEMETGKIEIAIQEIRILSEAETPPFHIEDADVKDDIRLKYRYLDLRRPSAQKNIIIRHKTAQVVREFLTKENFLEIETPVLTKSTPEGARDYLVPSRIHPASFYALPQSPQLFKQLLMVAGFDKYFQIVKCFRDEDLRADRQPEFTQIDMELSFADMEDVISVNERLVKEVFKKVLDVDIEIPFMRISYKEAMERYGSDKPDIRFSMELVNLTETVKDSDFNVFKSAIDSNGSVKCINAKGCGNFPRKQIDALGEYAKTVGAKGLAWIAISDNGDIKSPISKFFSEDKMQEIISQAKGEPGDLILICADTSSVVYTTLGSLRVHVAKKLGILKDDDYRFLWVTGFPLFEWSEEDKRFTAMHHPFTSPFDEDLDILESDPGEVRAKAYDMVLNGVELGGGSIRIHRADIQQKMFNILGFSEEQAYEQFGYLLNAFKYGVPPHGGLAFGFDRLIMLMVNAQSLRDVIAFPKAKDASCPLTEAPSEVDQLQLNELGLEIKKEH